MAMLSLHEIKCAIAVDFRAFVCEQNESMAKLWALSIRPKIKK